MEKKEVKGIPYGVASFEEVRSKDRYYVDKTITSSLSVRAVSARVFS